MSEHDPAAVDIEKVTPGQGLGNGFDRAAFPSLVLSTKRRVWGDPHPKELEPTVPDYLGANLRRDVLAADGNRCMFCGLHSASNEVHNLSDNHLDVRLENLRAVDPLCHAWHHLGELEADSAFIAYLPGLSGRDVNHLQRTIMVALQSDDQAVREDAKTLLNWLASHRIYAKGTWGTYEPSVFAEAIARLDEQGRSNREVVFEGLAVVFNPGPYSQKAALWSREARSSAPIENWSRIYHDVMHAAA
ncbi:conserved hypothetical protein [Burkholderia diffusa]|uniref:HNH endonuclease n=1 Tax=Burkholderia diffusa TaxID=488732 RepID=UPI001CB0BA12|nr:HNH endonuclease [Burkholderia diffusa]CAG9260899.1 conserved hypothetical protein [Burkholderia diffusa]